MITDYLKLCRVSNLPTVWSNVLAAVVLSGTELTALHFALPAVSMSLFYSAGMAMNDVVDAGQDRLKRPLRPVPAGRVSPFSAGLFTVLLFAAGLVTLAIAPYAQAFWYGIVLLVLIVIYNLLHAGYRGSVLLMAGCRFMVFAISAAAFQGQAGMLVLVAGTIQFLYTVAIAVTARLEKQRDRPFLFPVMPFLIAGFSLIDGFLLAILLSPAWFFAGLAAAVLTLLGQTFVRGD